MALLHANPLLSLFLIIATGLLLGAIRIKNVSLGASGIIFSSLGLGMLGCTIPAGVDTLGLVLFVYAVGISAGPGFFRAFVHQGVGLAKLGLFITGVGALTTLILALTWKVPVALAAGIFAGSLTSTPALAAALDVVQDSGAVSVGYGLAYPFGVLVVVLFVQFVPRLLRVDLDAEAAAVSSQKPPIIRTLIEVRNQMLFGRKVMDVGFLKHQQCCLSRVLEGEQLIPLTPETTFEEGMMVLAVGETEAIDDLAELMGRKSNRSFVIDAQTSHKVVLTAPEILGKTMGELNLLARFGISITGMSRHGVEFVPGVNTVFQQADILTVEGPRDSISEFMAFAGHRRRILNETDLVAVAVGIGAGLILGLIPIGMPGSRGFTLGLAGGPLITGLFMAHFGRIGKIRGYIPPAARLMMMNLGLAFFLAGAGIKAGTRLPEIIAQYGPMLMIMAVLVTLIPMSAGYAFARKVLRLNTLQVLGGICGGMTSTPGLGAVTERVDSEVPAMSYAAAYPVALILMTLFTQIIVRILG